MSRARFTLSRLMGVVFVLGLGLAGLKIAQLSARLRLVERDAAGKQETLTTIIRALRDRLGRPANPLDRPDGYVIEVHRGRQEVVISIDRSDGIRPRLRASIFDPASPDLPALRPKALIEVTRVDEESSTARIIGTTDATRPIRVGDHVYAHQGWSPHGPTRFALVGMIDANRDNKDDREELKRLIQAAGGVIDYDLPPPDVGPETGTLLPRIDWYVIDERAPHQPEFTKRRLEAIREARLLGIRPMPIHRLPAELGHDDRPPATPGPPAGMIPHSGERRPESPR